AILDVSGGGPTTSGATSPRARRAWRGEERRPLMPQGHFEPTQPRFAGSARLDGPLIPGPDGPPLDLDLAGVGTLTAGGVGELVALHDRLAGSGGRLVLWNVGPAAFEAMALT